MKFNKSTLKKQRGVSLIELMIVMGILAVIASIAIAQHDNYAARAQASESLVMLAALKSPISESIYKEGVVDGCQMPAVATTAGTFGDISVPPIVASPCVLKYRFKSTGVNSRLADLLVTMTYDAADGSWTCDAGALPADLRPKGC